MPNSTRAIVAAPAATPVKPIPPAISETTSGLWSTISSPWLSPVKRVAISCSSQQIRYRCELAGPFMKQVHHDRMCLLVRLQSKCLGQRGQLSRSPSSGLNCIFSVAVQLGFFQKVSNILFWGRQPANTQLSGCQRFASSSRCGTRRNTELLVRRCDGCDRRTRRWRTMPSLSYCWVGRGAAGHRQRDAGNIPAGAIR